MLRMRLGRTALARQAHPADRGHRLRRRGAAAQAAARRPRLHGGRDGPPKSGPAAPRTGSPSCWPSPSSPTSPRAPADRVETLSGDLNAVPELPRDLDVVVHCAGDVSFDPPIQSAFDTNVVGVKALMERVVEAAHREDGSADDRTDRCTTSTSRPPTWAAGAAARSWRPPSSTPSTGRPSTRRPSGSPPRIEDTSRTPAVLQAALAKAEKHHDRAGPLAVAADAEERRRTWVADQQKAAGGDRARTPRLDRRLHLHQGPRRAGRRAGRPPPVLPDHGVPARASSSPP